MKSKKQSQRTSIVLSLITMSLFFGGYTAFCAENAGPRRIIDLDGRWEIAEGSMDSAPRSFERKVPVPGLVDMAEPAEELAGGTECQFKIYVINDLYQDWTGTVRLRIVRSAQTIAEQARNCTVGSLAREILTFEQEFPKQAGEYQLVAELVGANSAVVRSLRDFKIVPASNK